jgi:hypothetical protein
MAWIWNVCWICQRLGPQSWLVVGDWSPFLDRRELSRDVVGSSGFQNQKGRPWKFHTQPRWPSACEWTSCIYTVEYYSVIKKNTTTWSAGKWVALEIIGWSEIRQTIYFTCYTKKKNTQESRRGLLGKMKVPGGEGTREENRDREHDLPAWKCQNETHQCVHHLRHRNRFLRKAMGPVSAKGRTRAYLGVW